MLDLVLSTEEDRLGNLKPLCPTPGCGHIPDVLNYYFMLESSTGNNSRSGRQAWLRGKYSRIDEHISGISWDYEFCYLFPNSVSNRFTGILTPLSVHTHPCNPSQLFSLKFPTFPLS